jgi:ERCC4-type nuclease
MQPLEIVIDIQEKMPWVFDPQDAHCVRRHLRTGDYALAGDDGFVIERKSLNDFLGTISSGWKRFEKEMRRAHERGFVMPVIVEGDVDDMLWSTSPEGDLIEPTNDHPCVHASLVLRQIAQIIVRHGHSFIPCKNAANAAAIAYACLCERRAQLDEEALKEAASNVYQQS